MARSSCHPRFSPSSISENDRFVQNLRKATIVLSLPISAANNNCHATTREWWEAEGAADRIGAIGFHFGQRRTTRRVAKFVKKNHVRRKMSNHLSYVRSVANAWLITLKACRVLSCSLHYRVFVLAAPYSFSVLLYLHTRIIPRMAER